MELGDYPYPVLQEISCGGTLAEEATLAELSLLLDEDKRVEYQSLDGNVVKGFELNEKATMIRILDEETYQQAPVNVTLKLTEGFGFSQDSLV